MEGVKKQSRCSLEKGHKIYLQLILFVTDTLTITIVMYVMQYYYYYYYIMPMH